jgi:hypothetical protein
VSKTGDPDVEEKGNRSKMKATSEAMRAWAEALAREVDAWPGVELKRAFGMTLVYRKGIVFAALPLTRALYEEDAILVKFLSEPPRLAGRIATEPRFAAGTMEQRRTTKSKKRGEGHRWRIFMMRADADVHDALEWLAEAYGLAAQKAKSGRS